MQIEYAILADAVKIRDGLLYVIAGGITSFTPPALPAPLTLSLAVKFKGTRGEVERPHQLEVRFVDEDGRPSPDLQTLNMPFTPTPGSQVNGLDAEINIVVEMQSALIRRPGNYMIDIILDGHSYKRMPLTIAAQSQQAA